MSYKNFSQYVSGFSTYGQRQATTIKPFIKTYRQTYSQLQKQVYKSANYLLAQGVKKGDRVMVVAANSPQWQELSLGCLTIGAIITPVDARNSLETTLGFAAQTTPKLLFRGQYVLPQLDKKLFKAGILEDYDEIINAYPDKKPKVSLTGEEPAVIIFTSGTTAAPKGVVLTQRNLLTNIEGVVKALEIDPDWRILSILPLSHSYEFTGELCMMARGVSIFYLPRITPLAIAKALNDYKLTTLLAVPQLLALFKQRILQAADAEGQGKTLGIALKIAPALPKPVRRLLFSKVHKKLGGHLEIVVTGGAPIPTDVGVFWEKMGVRALQGYGLTETAPILTVNPLRGTFRDSQGRALHNVELKIADDGEILARGPNIFAGYWKDKAKTKSVFTRDGWFKTGDIGRIDDGWLKIQGRAKFMMVLPSGMNVFPEDIEMVAEKHPAIKEVCVVGVKKPDGEEVFAAIISDKNDKQIKRAISEINEQLEDFQHISSWERWPDEQFPRTLLLKIDRKNVQAWANETRKDRANRQPQTNEVADPIVSILRQSLDDMHAVVGEHERLSAAGIDSLRRLAVISLIEEQLGVSIPEPDITKTTTLADLRKLVAHGGHAATAAKRPAWQYHPVVRFIGNTLRETLVRGVLGLFVSFRVEGTANLKNLQQPAIFIFNHVDAFDSAVTYQSLPASIRNHMAVAAANDMLVRHKVLTFGTRLGYAGFNLDRQDNILPSLEYTVGLLEKGWNILIAPEGHVSKDGTLQEFKSGIGLLAVETGLPVVPVKTTGLAGTLPLDKKWPQKHAKVQVTIGKPISFDKHVSYEKAAKQLFRTMAEL